MPWPYDARDFNFVKGLFVPSKTLNEMQDRIIDMYRDVHVFATSFHDQDGDWKSYDGAWNASGSGGLNVYPSLRTDAIVKDLWIKYYLAPGGTVSLTFVLYYVQPMIDDPHMTPAKSYIFQKVADGQQDSWNTAHFPLDNIIINDDLHLMIQIHNAQPLDKVFAVKLKVQPLTAKNL